MTDTCGIEIEHLEETADGVRPAGRFVDVSARVQLDVSLLYPPFPFISVGPNRLWIYQALSGSHIVEGKRPCREPDE